MTYAKGAAILCQNPKFWQYIEFNEPGVQVKHRDTARDWIYATLEIASRTELDTCPMVRAKWLATLKDFNQYLNGYGATQKIQPWRSDEYRALARVAPCMRCHQHKGTGKVVCAHAMGEVATQFGKGKSEKPSDFASAYLCFDCHGLMDAYENTADPIMRALEWSVLIIRTHEWLLRNGFVQIVGES